VVVLPTAVVGRFFDLQYTNRPGGHQTAIELAAMRRVVELHEGSVQVQCTDRGCTLLVTLPAA
jgi:light-regulated signal transduction histidine kinase (bacteriophytochrome)